MDWSFDPGAVRIHDSGDIARAATAFAAQAKALGGFRVAACANIASSRSMTDADGNVLASSVFGWDLERQCWWTDKTLAHRSPIPRICRYESGPVWANADGARKRGPSAFLDALDFSTMKLFTSVKALIIVPIHLPFSQVAAVSFSCIDNARDDLSREYDEYADRLHHLSQVFITSYVDVCATRRHVPRNCNLTRRETECLRWAAVGKTDAEIAELISRTHGTVRYHMQNSSEKLNAVTRTQAVFKAAQLGYLGIAV